MWHFNMQGLPAYDVTIKSRELLPHVFNLTPTLSEGEREGSYFLWHCLFAGFETSDPAIHRCIALCCPDFPPPTLTVEDDSLACSKKFKRANHKNNHEGRIGII